MSPIREPIVVIRASDLLRWPGAAGWTATVRERLRQAAGDGVCERARNRPPGANRAFDEPWLAEVLGPGSRRAAGELVDQLAADLAERYRAVRAYHAGRPADPGAYRRSGLLLATPERLLAEAREVFAGEEAALAEILPRQDLSLVDGRLALHLDERFLLRSFTFYALYGSHFLLGLAVQLERATGRPQRHRLRERGVPTVAACDVPLGLLPPEALRQLCCEGVRGALGLYRNHSGKAPGEEISDLELTLAQPLPPELVVACRHPRRLIDHLGGPGGNCRTSGATFSSSRLSPAPPRTGRSCPGSPATPGAASRGGSPSRRRRSP